MLRMLDSLGLAIVVCFAGPWLLNELGAPMSITMAYALLVLIAGIRIGIWADRQAPRQSKD